MRRWGCWGYGICVVGVSEVLGTRGYTDCCVGVDLGVILGQYRAKLPKTGAVSCQWFDFGKDVVVLREVRSDDEKEAIVAGYVEKGLCFSDLCGVFHVSPKTLRKWLAERGYSVRGRGRFGRVELDRCLVEGLLGDGVSVREVSRRLGVGRGVVGRRVREWGLVEFGEYRIT